MVLTHLLDNPLESYNFLTEDSDELFLKWSMVQLKHLGEQKGRKAFAEMYTHAYNAITGRDVPMPIEDVMPTSKS